MSRPIRVQAELPVPLMRAARAFRLEPSSWLPMPVEHTGKRWKLYLWAGKIGLLVEVTIGACRRDQDDLRRLVCVEPDRFSFLGRRAPSLWGDLVVSRQAGTTMLVLEGRYQPPLGWLGDLLDRFVMHPVAEATARRFVVEAASSLAVTAEATESLAPQPAAHLVL